MKNIFLCPNLWLNLVRLTLIELGYPQTIQLSEPHWLCLFENELTPVKAVSEMEEIDLIQVAVAWSRVPDDVKR